MDTFYWILGSGVVMSIIALVGSITLILKESTLQRIILPLVAFAAGTLIGGAFFHMIPAGIDEYGNNTSFYLWLVGGFTLFFALEQILHWHHHHTEVVDHDHIKEKKKEPLTYLILIGDGLHNFVGGLAVAGTFLIDIKLGIMAWIAAAAHEIPQELGDFGVLVHGGWKKKQALLFNLLSAITFLIGGLISYYISRSIDVTFLVPFAAGNFIYIGATDLVPEFKKHDGIKKNLLYFTTFLGGLLLMVIIRLLFDYH